MKKTVTSMIENVEDIEIIEITIDMVTKNMTVEIAVGTVIMIVVIIKVEMADIITIEIDMIKIVMEGTKMMIMIEKIKMKKSTLVMTTN